MCSPTAASTAGGRALQSFYYAQKAIMSNEEFNNLKEELIWEGSSVILLSTGGQRLLEASMASMAGNPIMSDAEFYELKLKLKQDGSDIVTEGARCSLQSQKGSSISREERGNVDEGRGYGQGRSELMGRASLFSCFPINDLLFLVN